MLKGLVKIANRLDDLGLTKEADVIDAVLQKMATVEGLPGAKYHGGRQISPGIPGGQTVKFFASKPESIQKINEYLANLVGSFSQNDLQIRGKQVFSDELKKNPPKASDSRWTERTEAAFDAFAEAAGFPEAGLNWVEFAKNNRYAPSVDGIVAFMDDNLGDVTENLIRLRDTLARLGETSDSKSSPMGIASAPTVPVRTPTDLKPTGGKAEVTTISAPPALSEGTSSDIQLGLTQKRMDEVQKGMLAQQILNSGLANSEIDKRLDAIGYKRDSSTGVLKAVKK